MLKVGTDFSGIGSPEAALRRLNLPHKNIFACEIDKYAKKSYLELNDPGIFYEDITTRNHSEVEQLDLYVAGFPCQAFSYAGKRKGFADETRGTLFFDVAEFIRINQPNCFILENVRGLVSHDKGRTFQTITDILSNAGGSLNGQVGLDTIDNGLGYHVYYKILNTKNFGIPQNRERIFIVGFKNWREFRFPKEFPLDITLKDLLEDDVNEKYYLSQKMIDGFNRHKEINNKVELPKIIGYTRDKNGEVSSRHLKDEASTLHSVTGGGGNTDQFVIHNLHPRCGDPKKGCTGHLSKTDGIAYCLDAANSIAVELKQIGNIYDNEHNSLAGRIYDENGLSITLKSEGGGLGAKSGLYKVKNNIRRLTPLETWRLQGFTDEEFWKAQKVNSDTQLYKQAGNTITVNVMVEIFKKIYLK